jgi:hypothetical protein
MKLYLQNDISPPSSLLVELFHKETTNEAERKHYKEQWLTEAKAFCEQIIIPSRDDLRYNPLVMATQRDKKTDKYGNETVRGLFSVYIELINYGKIFGHVAQEAMQRFEQYANDKQVATHLLQNLRQGGEKAANVMSWVETITNQDYKNSRYLWGHWLNSTKDSAADIYVLRSEQGAAILRQAIAIGAFVPFSSFAVGGKPICGYNLLMSFYSKKAGGNLRDSFRQKQLNLVKTYYNYAPDFGESNAVIAEAENESLTFSPTEFAKYLENYLKPKNS